MFNCINIVQWQPRIYLINPFAPCASLGGSQYRSTFREQCLENGKSKNCLCQAFFKKYSTSFLMVCRLIEFALVVLKLLMFKVFAIIGISKIEFFNFSGTERVKQNQKIKNNSKPPELVSQSLFKQFRQIPNIFFGFLLKL